MPYVIGAVAHGVKHVADVYHSTNVYANHVPVALWLDPEGSEAGAYAAISSPSFTMDSTTTQVLEGETSASQSVVAAQQSLVSAGVITQAELNAGAGAGSNPAQSSTTPGTIITGTTTATVVVSSTVDDTLLLSSAASMSGIDYYVKTVTKQVSPTNRYGVIFPYDVATVAPANGYTVQEVCENLELLVKNCFDPIKSQYPKAFMTCSFRSKGVGSPTSQHPKGQACDIQFAGAAKSDYYNIATWIRDSSGIAYDQLILEYKTTGSGMPWIHISYNKDGNRGQVFTFMNNVNCKGPGVIGLYDLSNT
jgi:hypothetical protein